MAKCGLWPVFLWSHKIRMEKDEDADEMKEEEEEKE